MDRTILVALALIVVGDVITVVMAPDADETHAQPDEGRPAVCREDCAVRFRFNDTTLMLTLNYRVDTLMMGYMYHIPLIRKSAFIRSVCRFRNTDG